MGQPDLLCPSTVSFNLKINCGLIDELINLILIYEFRPPPPPKVEVNENYLPPCGNGGVGPNCDTSSGYNYNRPAIAFRY